MGEYAKLKTSGKTVKIGTCCNMYYLRWEQRGLVDYRFDGLEVFRLPRREEEGIEPGAFDFLDRRGTGARPVRVFVPDTLDERDEFGRPKKNPKAAEFAADLAKVAEKRPGHIQLHTENGLLVNAPCGHGHILDLPKGMSYNGHAPHQMCAMGVGVRGAPVVFIGCYFCGEILFQCAADEFAATFRPFGDEVEAFGYLCDYLRAMKATTQRSEVR